VVLGRSLLLNLYENYRCQDSELREFIGETEIAGSSRMKILLRHNETNLPVESEEDCYNSNSFTEYTFRMTLVNNVGNVGWLPFFP
jgi:hypothetical protein